MIKVTDVEASGTRRISYIEQDRVEGVDTARDECPKGGRVELEWCPTFLERLEEKK
jgi:hypothetical protein